MNDHTPNVPGVETPGYIALLPTTPVVSQDVMLQNMRAALERGLPELKICRPHGRTLSIAAGGPSLADTYKELEGFVVAMNGSLGWLLERGVVPFACGVLDPGEHMADVVAADPRVRYFVASNCAPRLFDKLQSCAVTLWHASTAGWSEPEDLLKEKFPADWMMVGGGSTMGLRWINLGYMLGFRKFHLHGLDSCFRDGETHAYADKGHKAPVIRSGQWETKKSFLAQVADFLRTLETLSRREFDRIEITVHGDGLLQDAWRKYQRAYPEAFKPC